jgi:hypothetical protein
MAISFSSICGEIVLRADLKEMSERGRVSIVWEVMNAAQQPSDTKESDYVKACEVVLARLNAWATTREKR